VVGGSVNGIWNSTFVMLLFLFVNGLTFKQSTFTYVNVHEKQP